MTICLCKFFGDREGEHLSFFIWVFRMELDQMLL